MDANIKPAHGHGCKPCNAKGHFCQAHEYLENEPICLNCLDDVACPPERLKQRGFPEPAREREKSPLAGKRLSDGTVDAIREDLRLGLPISKIAKKYSVTEATVYYHRKRVATAAKPAPVATPEPTVTAAEVVAAAVVATEPEAAEAVTDRLVTELVEKIEAEEQRPERVADEPRYPIYLTASQVEDLLAALPAHVKAVVLQAAYDLQAGR